MRKARMFSVHTEARGVWEVRMKGLGEGGGGEEGGEEDGEDEESEEEEREEEEEDEEGEEEEESRSSYSYSLQTIAPYFPIPSNLLSSPPSPSFPLGHTPPCASEHARPDSVLRSAEKDRAQWSEEDEEDEEEEREQFEVLEKVASM